MKILIVTNMYPTEDNPVWGIFIAEQVSALKNKIGSDNVDLLLVDGRENKFNYLYSIFRIKKLVENGNYDLIHVHYGMTLISLISRKKKTPVIITLHGSDALLLPQRMITKIFLRKSDIIIAVSENIKKYFPSAKIIPCGIEVDRFQRPSGISRKVNNPLKILFPSSPLNPIKDFELFKRICDALTAVGIDLKIITLDGIARNAVPNLFWDVDLMILTSRSEGSPTVIKEAIAAGLPFVSVNVGDVEQSIRRNGYSNGFVVDSRDHNVIAGVVLKVISSLPMVSEDSLELDFSMDLVTKELLDLYRASKIN